VCISQPVSQSICSTSNQPAGAMFMTTASVCSVQLGRCLRLLTGCNSNRCSAQQVRELPRATAFLCDSAHPTGLTFTCEGYISAFGHRTGNTQSIYITLCDGIYIVLEFPNYLGVFRGLQLRLQLPPTSTHPGNCI